jgi:hypothetical protein
MARFCERSRQTARRTIQEADGPAESPRIVWTLKTMGVLSGITLMIDVFLELDFQRVCKGSKYRKS